MRLVGWYVLGIVLLIVLALILAWCVTGLYETFS